MARIRGCLFFLVLFALTDITGWPFFAVQEAEGKKADIFAREVETFELQDESIFDGLAHLNQSGEVGFGIEAILPPPGTAIKSQPAKFTVRRTKVTVAQLLDWFCELDGRYVWQRDGNIGNVYPRQILSDPDYIMNRKLRQLTFVEVPDAEKALFEARRQLGHPTAHLMLLQVGGSLSFAKPWTATFHDITFRQALNRIAEQLGAGYGWQLGGTKERPIMIFYARLGVRRQSRR